MCSSATTTTTKRTSSSSSTPHFFMALMVRWFIYLGRIQLVRWLFCCSCCCCCPLPRSYFGVVVVFLAFFSFMLLGCFVAVACLIAKFASACWLFEDTVNNVNGRTKKRASPHKIEVDWLTSLLILLVYNLLITFVELRIREKEELVKILDFQLGDIALMASSCIIRLQEKICQRKKGPIRNKKMQCV